MKKLIWVVGVGLWCALAPTYAFAESQGSEYKGISDPFGDPSNYEFAEDEKEDKEFFHLGRYIMFGVDLGMGIFTGGLGRTVSPGFYTGAKLLYFFDKSLALELAIHYSKHVDSVTAPGKSLTIDTAMIPITGGFRYYFDTKNAPRAIAIANPYLVLAGGMYIRQQTVAGSQGFVLNSAPDATTSSFGVNFGGGVEFNIYRKHIYLGTDVRYHLIFFPDESDTLGGNVSEGDRSGDMVTGLVSITYSW